MRLLYLSPVPLASFAQRPHHFVRWFHEHFDAEVLWVDPYPARLPRISDLRRLRHAGGPFLGPEWANAGWVHRMDMTALPFEPLAAGRWLNRRLWRASLARIDRFMTPDTWMVAGKPCELALVLAQRHPRQPLVFDVMDHVPAFASGLSGRWLAKAESRLARRADWVLTSSTALYERFAEFGDKRRLVMNGLTPVSDEAASAAPEQRSPHRLVLGYVGAIASWFDWPAVVDLAQRNPDAVIRLIGPCDARPAALPANIECLPAIPQHQVYRTMREFSAGLIPFLRNPLTECVDPVKYYEYRALGLPVLSTRFGEMRLRGVADHVWFLEDQPDRETIRRACENKVTPSEVNAFRQHHQWSARFGALDFFDQALGLSAAGPR